MMLTLDSDFYCVWFALFSIFTAIGMKQES